ncbi:MarR family winged helix-turn-helix transcriptional regulator [Methylocapsa aurea]|uniref:MarR family winged helix-turn-helix transcriptional regulator n=1 Tax=Methylocapsa aurea TaxID=663610 RepID=UPI00068A004A|nr:MarR family transcriptional regulator [Methylocapsa aurea]
MDSFLSKKADLPCAALAPLVPDANGTAGGEPWFDLIELMFFAYRDFVGDADQLLENFGLGRAHHRVLHFVNRRPGLTIAELLDILKITKQSLNRVLKELLDTDYVVSHPGANDRRQRQLFPTARGKALALDVARLQSKRFSRVFAQLPEGARSDAVDFLLAIVDAGERDKVAAMVASDRTAAHAGTKR